MDHDRRTALVTGVTGFLGRRVASELRASGWNVVGVATRSRDWPLSLLDEYHALRLPAEELGELVARVKPNACVHCAGRASVDLSVTDPGADFEASVVVTAQLLEVLRREAPRCRVVYASSAAVYGQPTQLPIAESCAGPPLSPYGDHRRVSGELGREYAEAVRDRLHRGADLLRLRTGAARSALVPRGWAVGGLHRRGASREPSALAGRRDTASRARTRARRRSRRWPRRVRRVEPGGAPRALSADDRVLVDSRTLAEDDLDAPAGAIHPALPSVPEWPSSSHQTSPRTWWGSPCGRASRSSSSGATG